jgi:anti-anti-sigma regulatory factor
MRTPAARPSSGPPAISTSAPSTLSRRWSATCDGPGFDRIVLDLSAISFLDSSGLRLLLSLRNDAHRNHHGRRLR